jgi:Carboxypeptidase regulatory-like domain/TonB dependent receptor-like, beta-barrel
MRESKKCVLWGFVLFAVSFLVSPPTARAQVVYGAFTGVVTDQTGAVVPGAVVTATNEGTNVSVSQTTNAQGLYTIPNLLPGLYTVKAEAKGFKAFVNTHNEITTGYTQRLDFKLEVGAVTQEVTVTSAAPLVDTESNRLSELVTGREVQNLPLNGRNVFELIQLAPGAVNTTNLITEPGNRGFTTVVNGARVNMNGYEINGISDKGLSGGSNTQPSIDSIQEFRVDTSVLSAEFGSTVGAMTQISTKSGTNSYHGDAYEFVRNDKLNARNFFEADRNPFKLNQFGGTIGGPIKKNKWFFFGSYEGERSRIFVPQQEVMETPQFHSLVESAAPNSVAALLYKNFPGPSNFSGPLTPLSDYVTNVSGFCKTFNAACIQSYGLDPSSGLGAALLANPTLPTFGTVNTAAKVFTSNQFYDGNQWSARLDYQGDKDKVFGSYFFDKYADPFYTPATNGGAAAALVGVRGFASPTHDDFPQLALNWTHSFSPTVLNEMRAGWNRNVGDIGSNNPGVPLIYTDPGEVEFGNYNGYPQIFHEEVFQYKDMVTISHGKHEIKFGGNIQRNYENSEFNVGRPSYEFYDSVSLAAGLVESVAAGVDPGTIDPKTGQSTGQAHLSSNIRGFRNWVFGGFINDNWKVNPRLSLILGLRYDLYTRQSDKYNHDTQLLLPSGANLTERLRNVNCYVNTPGAIGADGQPCNGGFEGTLNPLTTGDYNNFGPRVGFAWDVKGDGKTSLRGGFGVSYQGEIYNPLSNSRWDAPFYSFDLSLCGTGVNNPGPGNSDTCVFGPLNGAAPTFTGPPSNIGAGPAGATANAFQGNIAGWNPYNANGAYLTGVVFPGFRDPYVYASQLSLEHQFAGNFVLKTSWVGTFAHKLYRAEDINRTFAGRDLLTGSGPADNGVCALFGPYRVNCLYGRIRTWENSVNSNYNGLQVVLDKKMSHNLELHANYVWSHSIDGRSTWHSGATSSNGAAEGFSMDQALPGLDNGNSLFDVRHSFSLSAVYTMPWYASQQGFVGHLLGGWQANGVISIHSGFPWTPYCSDSSFPSGSCDFNRDGVSNDRPNVPGFGLTNPNTSNAAFEANNPSVNLIAGDLLCGANGASPVPGCTAPTSAGNAFDGNLGRNTFRGPNFREVDFSLFKNIKISERVTTQFRAEGFNIFNRTNLYQPNARLGQSASLFGLSTQAFFPRQIQFGLKLLF